MIAVVTYMQYLSYVYITKHMHVPVSIIKEIHDCISQYYAIHALARTLQNLS